MNAIKQPRSCPRPEELERSFWQSDDAFVAHREGCSDCAAAWAEISKLALSCASLPGPHITRDRKEDVRTAILASTLAGGSANAASAPTSSRRRRVAVTALIAGLAAGALLYVGLERGRHPLVSFSVEPIAPVSEILYRGAVASVGGDALYSIESSQPDEVVRLERGTISVEVDELGEGERFRVVTADAEIEVRGTSFEVSAEGTRLVSVVVRDGAVVVRAAAGERLLSRGERWELVAARDDGHADAPSPPRIDGPEGRRPKRAPDQTNEPQIQTPSDLDASVPRAATPYEIGWSHLRERRYIDAAAAFERSVDQEGANVADSIYWASVAHFRAGKQARARVLLRRFLADHPSDSRRAEVSVMLGWIEIDREDFTTARELFEVGATARSAKVRKSAAAGLAAAGKGIQASD